MNQNIKLWTRDFWLLSLANFGMFTTFYFLIPTLPAFCESELGLNKSETGLVLAIYTISALAIRPFAGLGLDRWGRRGMLLISFLLFILFYPVYLVAGSFFLLLIIRIFHGILWGTVTTSGSTSAIDIIPGPRRGEGIGYYGLFITLAMSMGPLIGLWLAGSEHYTRLFLSSLLIGLLAFFLLLGVRFPDFKPTKGASLRFSHLFEPAAFRISGFLLINSIPYGGLLSFLASYAGESGLGHAGLYFFILATGIGIMRILSGKVFDRRGPDQVMVFGVLVLSLGFPVLGLSSSVFFFLASAFLIGLGSGVILPTSQAMVNDLVPPHRRGAVNSTLFTAFDLGIGIGMLGTGWVGVHWGLGTAFLIFGISSLISLGVYLAYVRLDYRRRKALLA